MKKIDINKLILPIAIILGCLILGGVFYKIQVEKQKSIEKQQQIEQSIKEAQQIKDNEKQDLLLKQNECESLSVGVMKKWNNVMGVTYDKDFWGKCVVTYTDTKTGEVKTTPLEYMQTTKNN